MAQSISTGKRTPNLNLIGAACPTEHKPSEVADDGNADVPETIARLSSRFAEFESGLKKLQRLNREMRERLHQA